MTEVDVEQMVEINSVANGSVRAPRGAVEPFSPGKRLCPRSGSCRRSPPSRTLVGCDSQIGGDPCRNRRVLFPSPERRPIRGCVPDHDVAHIP